MSHIVACYPEPEELCLNSQKILSLPRCRFHIVAQEQSDKLQNNCPTRSLDRCTESILIDRLLEVKGESVKAFSFYRVWNTAEGEQEVCTGKANEFISGLPCRKHFTW